MPTSLPTSLMPGSQIDLLRDMLRAVLPPKKDDQTLSRAQDLASKVKVPEKLPKQADHHRKVVLETEDKLAATHQRDVSDLCLQASSLQLQIAALQAQVATSPPGFPVVPSFVPSGTPAYSTHGQFGWKIGCGS